MPEVQSTVDAKPIPKVKQINGGTLQDAERCLSTLSSWLLIFVLSFHFHYFFASALPNKQRGRRFKVLCFAQSFELLRFKTSYSHLKFGAPSTPGQFFKSNKSTTACLQYKTLLTFIEFLLSCLRSCLFFSFALCFASAPPRKRRGRRLQVLCFCGSVEYLIRGSTLSGGFLLRRSPLLSPPHFLF